MKLNGLDIAIAVIGLLALGGLIALEIAFPTFG